MAQRMSSGGSGSFTTDLQLAIIPLTVNYVLWTHSPNKRAMAKKSSKKTPVFQKVVLVGIVLIVVQIGLFLFFRSANQSQSVSESVTAALSNTSLGERRRIQAKIQIAVVDFQRKNDRLPKSLDELKPDYFESVPIDSETQKPFLYEVEGTKFFIGGREKSAQAPAPGQDDQTAHGTPSAEDTNYVYDPTGKRDPFRPFDISPKASDLENRSPLERYDLGSFKLTAVLSDPSNPSATVELADGKGFILKKGTKIGLNGGEVVDIQPSKVLILESFTDFTGQKTNKTLELNLRTKDQEAANKR